MNFILRGQEQEQCRLTCTILNDSLCYKNYYRSSTNFVKHKTKEYVEKLEHLPVKKGFIQALLDYLQK